MKPISSVLEPILRTTIWVDKLPWTVIYILLEAPEVKLLPKVPTIVLFCLMAKTLLPQPFDPESVIVMIKSRVLGHPESEQKTVKYVVAVNVDPLALWKITVPLGAVTVNPISSVFVPSVATTI